MKNKDLIEKTTLLLLVLSCSFSINLAFINELASPFPIQLVNGATIPFIPGFSFDSSPSNNLYVAYREQLTENNKLLLLTADSDYQWNYTAEIITQENASFVLDSEPSLQAGSNKIWIASSYNLINKKGMLLYTKNYLENEWNFSIIFSNLTSSCQDPKILLDKVNETLWLSWVDNHEITNNIYYMTYNLTSEIWSNNYTVNTINGFDCSDYDFILDNSGNAHFIWSQGVKPSNEITFRSVMSNGTMSSVEVLTNGLTNCVNPTLVFDSDNYVNAVWENQTELNPGDDVYGTINIQTSRKLLNESWSSFSEIAPYIPVDRPASSKSDALQPTVAIDKTDNLWLAYRVREDYAYRQGIDIRRRSDLSWEPSVKVSYVSNLALQPFLKCDIAGNLHCLWLDQRTGNFNIYYKVKFPNNLWSNEIRLTRYNIRSGNWMRFALITIGVIAVLTIPSALLTRYIRKREERKIKRKIDLLQ